MGQATQETEEQYPEHEKLRKVKKDSYAIGLFLDHSPYVLATWEQIDGEDVLLQTPKTIQQVLADYFEIDLNEIEREKRAMLDAHRKANP